LSISKRNKNRLYIGTSGWIYSDWEGVFYPQEIKSKKKLNYFSQHFKTTEINYSFYHLPRPATYQNWYSQVPEDFLFSVKVSRFITHIKRLKEIEKLWETFLENALHLKEKLGPILFQFPPSFKANDKNIKRLEEFLESNTKCPTSLVMEFRHQSWCNKKIYQMLKKHKAAWVIADSSRYPRVDVITADFVYLRLHGPEAMFSSKYTKKQLESLSQKIKKWLKSGDVYCYFNNDANAYAIENAKELLKMSG
jgi:uncharacterized protein YecE (DUF72 family)